MTRELWIFRERRPWPGIVAGALLLCWPAALNGYPLVFADTGNYLGQALEHFVGWNAPPFYSFFLLATDLRLTLWLPILAQGLIAAHLIHLVLRQFGWRGSWPVLAACAVLAFGSSLPWVVSLLTTDVFTGLLVLTLWLLAFGTVGPWERRYLTLLAIGEVAVHLSHVPLSIGLTILATVLAAVRDDLRAGLRVFGRLAIAPAVAMVLLVSVNLVAHGIASPAPYGSVVAAARFIGDGTARDYLRASCATQHYRICPYLDQLGPGGAVFEFQSPVLNAHLGGGKAWAPEARRIVMGTLAYEPGAVTVAALRNFIRLFGHLWLGDPLTPWPGDPGPAPLIARFFPHDLPEFQASEQEAGRLQAEAARIAPVQLVLAWSGMAALVALVVLDRRNRLSWTLCVVVLAAVLGNALITAGLSGVEDRYESRVAWLFFFAPATVLASRALTGRLAAALGMSGYGAA